MACKVLGIIELILGVIGMIMGFAMYGDIGIACAVGAIGCIFSGISFIVVGNALKKISENSDK